MAFETPRTPDQLHAWLASTLGITIPREPVLPGSSAPFDYLCFAFFAGVTRPRTAVKQAGASSAGGGAAGDCVLWACRGGGKTYLGAVATVLDLVFRPGIEVRILAGSLEQAGRMHAHLRRFFDRAGPLGGMVRGRITDRRLVLRNGSSVELLAQSETSVRGTRVQKLRCDEVDLIHPDVWNAAQLTTRSKKCGEFVVRGSVECLSTMQVPFGVMHKLVEECREGKRRLFRWGVVDVVTGCGSRSCDGKDAEAVAARAAGLVPEVCPLYVECGGLAKRRAAEEGHVDVADAVDQKRRVPLAVWESEMLCLRARRTDAVLPEFDARVHVFDHSGPAEVSLWCAGMDFGIRAPTAIVLAALARDGTLWVMDERVVAGEVVSQHLEALRGGLARDGVAWPRPEFVAPDPAGQAVNDQTGKSAVSLVRSAGFGVRISRATVMQGLRLLRSRLAPATGDPARLYVHRRCRGLIEALERYHYDPRKPESTAPVKGEFDHAVDALRYLVQALDMPGRTGAGAYAWV